MQRDDLGIAAAVTACGCCAALGLEMRFAPTYSLLCLHVWLALVRLRAEGNDGRDMAQMMYEDFQEDVERRVRAEGVKVVTLVSRGSAWV